MNDMIPQHLAHHHATEQIISLYMIASLVN